MARERRAKNTVRSILEDVRGKILIKDDLKDKLGSYLGKMKIQICRKARLSGIILQCLCLDPAVISCDPNNYIIYSIFMLICFQIFLYTSWQKNSHEDTKQQREFDVNLHLYSPKANTYLRESLNMNLSHPHTLQRYCPCYLKSCFLCRLCIF